MKRLTREQMAARVARDIPDGACVNLGIGLPTLVANHLLPDREVVLHGRFSPRPNVWTGFMAVYGVLSLVGLGGVMLGWAQTTVDEYPWGFWLGPAALALIAFVYGAAVIGQGLTQDEMYLLRNFVDRMVAGDERDDDEPAALESHMDESHPDEPHTDEQTADQA